MYALIGLIAGTIIGWIINKVRIKIARKNMVYIPESDCWVKKEWIEQDGEKE